MNEWVREDASSALKEARLLAKEYGVEIGKLTTSKDSQGEYTLMEDGHIVAQGWYDYASEIKADYINEKIGEAA